MAIGPLAILRRISYQPAPEYVLFDILRSREVDKLMNDGADVSSNLRHRCPICSSAPTASLRGVMAPWIHLLSPEDYEQSLTSNSATSGLALKRCDHCDFRWTDCGLPESLAAGVYGNYRNDVYLAARRTFEPWYSRKLNELSYDDAYIRDRQSFLATSLPKEVDYERSTNVLLDFGGDRGQFIPDAFSGYLRCVVESSDQQVVPGVNKFPSLDTMNLAVGRPAIVLVAHVFEHLQNPLETLLALREFATSDALLYIEVPLDGSDLDCWSPIDAALLGHAICTLSVKALEKSSWRLLWVVTDFIATVASRGPRPVRTRRLKFSEHINFFSETSVRELCTRAGFEILSSGLGGSGDGLPHTGAASLGVWLKRSL